MQLNFSLAASVAAFVAVVDAYEVQDDKYEFSLQAKSCANIEIKDYTGPMDSKWKFEADSSIEADPDLFHCGTQTYRKPADWPVSNWGLGYVVATHDVEKHLLTLRLPAYLPGDFKSVYGCVERAEQYNAATQKWEACKFQN